jgi:hypothetical protein
MLSEPYRTRRVLGRHCRESRIAREAAGKPITVEDPMIAATARAYDVTQIITRNIGGFVDCGVALIDPRATN